MPKAAAAAAAVCPAHQVQGLADRAKGSRRAQLAVTAPMQQVSGLVSRGGSVLRLVLPVNRVTYL